MRLAFLVYSISLFFLVSCDGPNHASIEEDKETNFYRRHAQDKTTGEYLADSLTYPGNQPIDPITGEIDPLPVPDWNYVDQRNQPFGNKDLLGKVYVAEFFFTSCPTICPKVKGQMLRLEEEFADEPDFAMVSFTVDPKRDTPERMLEYAEKLGIKDMDRWRFIYGDKFEIMDLDQYYLSIAEEDASAPGGFNHSGYIVLVDRQGFVRSYASGLDEEEVDYLMNDIKLLLKK